MRVGPNTLGETACHTAVMASTPRSSTQPFSTRLWVVARWTVTAVGLAWLLLFGFVHIGLGGVILVCGPEPMAVRVVRYVTGASYGLPNCADSPIDDVDPNL